MEMDEYFGTVAKQSPAVNMQRVIAKINLGLFYPVETKLHSNEVYSRNSR